jgi:hypothetical protein
MTSTVHGNDAMRHNTKPALRQIAFVGFALLALTATHASPAARRAAKTSRPNVVFILVDDLGWRDTSAYGSAFYETPSVERLARRGMTFTQAHAANPLCSPTRASILTGQYPCRLRITVPSGHIREELLDPVLLKQALCQP